MEHGCSGIEFERYTIVVPSRSTAVLNPRTDVDLFHYGHASLTSTCRLQGIARVHGEKTYWCCVCCLRVSQPENTISELSDYRSF